jgi:hypothetical protein
MKLLLICFILSISQLLQAEENSFVDSPEGCFAAKRYPCSLRAVGPFLSFERDSQKFHLAPQSALLFFSPASVQLMKGKLWIQNSQDLSVKASPNLQMQFTGEFFIEKQSDATLLVRNLSGHVAFQSRSVFKNESLPIGFQNWYGPLDASGAVSRGIIRPIVITEFLRSWIPISGLSVAAGKKALLDYREQWKEGVEQSAQLYKEVIERRLASHEAKERKQRAREQALKKEQDQFRQMYREKNGL